MPSHHGVQIPPLLRNRLVHAMSQLFLDCLKLSSHSFGAGQSQNRKLTLAGLPATSEAEELEGMRFACAATSAGLARKAPERNRNRCITDTVFRPQSSVARCVGIFAFS
jgi:hypothetical protein